jgi:hypothetical protein
MRLCCKVLQEHDFLPKIELTIDSLPQPKDDQALEAAVTREFRKFGTVFVKIRRDIHQMPFAFCQFTVGS